MLKLIFITHPQVVIDPDVPIDEWRLSDEGLKRSEGLIKNDFLNSVIGIYSSREPKAYTVANLIAKKANLENHQVECLGEIKNRSFIPPDLFLKATQEWFSNPGKSVNGWESLKQAEERIISCVSSIMSKHDKGSIAMVGHGGTGTLLKCYVKGVPASKEEDQPHTGNYFVADWSNRTLISDWKSF